MLFARLSSVRPRGRRRVARRVALLAAAIVALGALLLAGPARASSVYNPGGLGEPLFGEGARVRSLGGAGVAEAGATEYSLVNPASLAEIRRLVLQATVMPSYRKVSANDGSASETATETDLPVIRAAVRLKRGMVIGAAYSEMTDARFRSDRPESSGTNSHLIVDGSGGMQSIAITLARTIGRNARLGVDYEIVAGSYREEWIRLFDDAALSQSRDTVEVRYDRLGRWRFGGQAKLGRWTLGGVYELERKLPATIVNKSAGPTVVTSLGDLTIPDGWAVGASGNLSPRWHVTGQVRRANWSRSSLQSDLVDFRPMTRYSFGVERRRVTEDVTSWKSRFPIRFGVSYLEWADLLPLDGQTSIEGGTAGVNELSFAIGTGVLTQDKSGAIDLSLEAGTRGDKQKLGVSETFLRFAITLQIGDETWR